MMDWFLLELMLGLCAAAFAAIIALAITRLLLIREKTPLVQARTRQRVIPLMVAAIVGVLATHALMDAEVDGWQYGAIADDAKKDPVAKAGLREAMADGVMTEREYQAIRSDAAARLHEKLYREGLEAARAQSK